MTRKGEVIRNLIELSKWRRQLRAMTKLLRSDATMAEHVRRIAIGFDAIDNSFANLTAAVQATIQPRKSWQKQKAERLKAPVPKTET